jgi:hypothetical protein
LDELSNALFDIAQKAFVKSRDAEQCMKDRANADEQHAQTLETEAEAGENPVRKARASAARRKATASAKAAAAAIVDHASTKREWHQALKHLDWLKNQSVVGIDADCGYLLSSLSSASCA